MVVHVVPVFPNDADGETVDVCRASGCAPASVARCCGQVVDDPVHQVLVADHGLELFPVLLRERLLAQHLARHVLQHLHLVWRVLDQVALEDLPEILDALLNHRGLAVGQVVVAVRQLRLHRGQLVNFHLDLVALVVLHRGHARQVQRRRRPRPHADGGGQCTAPESQARHIRPTADGADHREASAHPHFRAPRRHQHNRRGPDRPKRAA
mmetsp:Transcript_105377/g.304829  ORF Transcript_105377/g.304829 Transcript_105377/m.304829 type:complete len:210 (+) Transcript_105377:1464-2093(+)